MFNIFYVHDGIEKKYCVENMDYETALEMHSKFLKRYTKSDGTPKTYPNGKGFFNISNVRMKKVA